MGFMDELKKLARPYAEDEDDFDDDFGLDERPRASRASTAARPAPRTAPSSSYDEVLDDLSHSNTQTSRTASRRTTDSKVVNIHTTTQLQVVLVKPDRFDNVSEIAEHLRSKHAVVSTSRPPTRTSPAAWWTSSPAAPTPWTARSKRSPFPPISSRPTTWTSSGSHRRAGK